ncbi:MAG: SAM-dependent chlorinase/fluorinase [Lewinella sp.]|nr:SAM-dependent chlorinase/fluorinase [Lewinella sp.]
MERNPPIVTLTSDFGWRDPHLALIKGKILTHAPNARLVDISHDIDPYDIVQAAFVFRHAWQAFPVGSIHVVSVHDFFAPDGRFLVLAQDGHYFIGPDNGLFSLVFSQRPAGCFAIAPLEVDSTFPLADLYGQAVGHLAQDFPPGGLGESVDSWTERITFQPVTGPNHIRGTVVYVDRFDNVVLNISRELFESVGKGRSFELFFKRHEPIVRLANHYYDEPVGEVLCRFNAADLLEIAINLGPAASLLGLHVEDTVQVDFRN